MSTAVQTAPSVPARAQAARRHPTATADTSSVNKVRCRRGLILFRERAAEIWRVGPDAYRVPSQADGGIYRVSLKPGEEHCTCPDYAHHGSRPGTEPGGFYCKHLYAALVWQVKSAAALADPAAV